MENSVDFSALCNCNEIEWNRSLCWFYACCNIQRARYDQYLHTNILRIKIVTIVQ